MESTQNHMNDHPGSSCPTTNSMPNVLFREIHKNAWLKRHPSDRRTGFPRKSERIWVVFCVHDDLEAFLEIYADQKVALTHKPDWFSSLNNTLHVSPSICGQEDEYEFAVTLPSQVIRLAAPTWELMMEWVETIRSKLRELKVLSPRENLYSKLPEHKLPLLPTRDPNSPLPLPPSGPSALVPGVEPVHPETVTENESSRIQRESQPVTNENGRNVTDHVLRSRVGLGRSESLRTAQETQNSDITQENFRSRHIEQINIQQIRHAIRGQEIVNSGQTSRMMNDHEESDNRTPVQSSGGDNSDPGPSRPRIRLSRAVSVPDSPVPHSSSLITPPQSADSNITVIEVSSNASRGSHSASEFGVFNFSVSERDLVGDENCDDGDVFLTPPVTPRSDSKVYMPDSAAHTESNDTEAHYEHVFVSQSASVIVAENPVELIQPKSPLLLNCKSNAKSSRHENGESNKRNDIIFKSTPSENNLEACTSSIVIVNDKVQCQPASIPVPSTSQQDDNQNNEERTSNSIISSKVQLNLEKISSTGLIPRINAKVCKHQKGEQSSSGSGVNLNVTVNNSSCPSTSLPEASSHSNGEIKDASSKIEINTPTAIAVSSKNRNDVFGKVQKSEISPLPMKRRVHESSNENSEDSKKPELLPRTTSIKSQMEIPKRDNKDSKKLLKCVKEKNNIIDEASSSRNLNEKAGLCKNEGHLQKKPLVKSNETSTSVPSCSNAMKIDPSNMPADKKRSLNSESSKTDQLPVNLNKNSEPTNQKPYNKNANEIVNKRTSSTSVNNNIESFTPNVQSAIGAINVQDIPLIGGHQRRRRRSSSSDANVVPVVPPPSRGIAGADRIRVNVTPLTVALPVKTEQIIGHQTRVEGERRGQSSLNPMQHQANDLNPIGRLTLREQQVMQLRKEMMHPGGVRLQLRRKDCMVSIALVDILGGVWIAGWKQREHPMLYNALHIGDQLISVAEVVVQSAADAQKLIRNSTSIYIEFIIRRVPFGRVYALHKSSEGQSLGIIQEGNTAEIRDIIPNSVAARNGLSAKTPSSDGLSLTNWYLTEINGRPLNLFFKDNEVKDRLNAVGKEISILVQPHDFIKQLKKNLKNIRSYKDYIVQ